ncbi:hypothetical protein Q3G72_022516 [Acer saccharum]|nr:hypothetical protein Q3G72_022516 [Acer saccharum]
MSSQSEDSLSLSLEKMIDDYQGDQSEVELDVSVASDSGHHDGEHDTDCGRYMIAARHYRGHLISELTTRDPDWKPKFFFAQGVLVDGLDRPRIMLFLDPVSDVERAFVAATMSNLKLLSSEDALKRLMDRIKKRKGKKVANVLTPPPQEVEPTEKVVLVESSGPPAKKANKRLHLNDESSNESLVIKFPSDVSESIQTELNSLKHT